jgi:hypothetical protein
MTRAEEIRNQIAKENGFSSWKTMAEFYYQGSKSWIEKIGKFEDAAMNQYAAELIKAGREDAAGKALKNKMKWNSEHSKWEGYDSHELITNRPMPEALDLK